MSTPVNPKVEGRSSVQLELRLPNNKVIPFDKIAVLHVSSTVSESLKRGAHHELVVRAPTTDFVDNILRFAQSKGTPRIRFRIGLGLPGQTAYLPWQDHILCDFNAGLEGLGKDAGHFVRIATSDSLFTIARRSKVTTRRGKISDIVSKIAKENGIPNAVIEPTTGEGMWVQSFTDDVDFIRNRLIPRAINAKGRGNFNLYVQDNVLHFHSPDYQAPLKDLVYYQQGNIGLFQIDESQHKLELGASGVRVVAYDPYTAQMREVSSSPEKALRFGNVMHQLTGAKGADLSYPFHLSTNSPSEASNLAQSIYENARSQAMGLRLEVTRSIFLRVGDILRINISPASNRNSVWSGTYLVTDASYTIEKGSSVAVFYVKRGEFQTSSSKPTSITVMGDNLIIDEQAAAGQPLNIQAAQSSVLTHGAGQTVFTSVFVNTQPSNTAPNLSPAN